MKKNQMFSLAMMFLAVCFLTFNFTASSAKAAGWGQWNTTQYSGINFRVKCRDSSPGRYWWDIEFRNSYRDTVHFSYALRDDGQTPSHFSYRESVSSGDTQEGMGNQLNTPCNGTAIKVFIGKVRVGTDSGPYINPN